MELYQLVAENNDVALSVNCPEDIYVTAHLNGMRRVVANLVDNAITYNRSGGRVAISVRRERQQTAISFSDTGAGIPVEAIRDIWERLYCGDKSRSQPGLGIGSSLVKAIVGARRSNIEVHSKPGLGSDFIVRLA